MSQYLDNYDFFLKNLIVFQLKQLHIAFNLSRGNSVKNNLVSDLKKIPLNSILHHINSINKKRYMIECHNKNHLFYIKESINNKKLGEVLCCNLYCHKCDLIQRCYVYENAFYEFRASTESVTHREKRPKKIKIIDNENTIKISRKHSNDNSLTFSHKIMNNYEENKQYFHHEKDKIIANYKVIYYPENRPGKVNIRAEPSLQSENIGSVYYGDILEVYQVINNEWIEIPCFKGAGYIKIMWGNYRLVEKFEIISPIFQKKCCICFDNIIEKCALVPCGHTNICQNCVKNDIHKCPNCMSVVYTFIKIHD